MNDQQQCSAACSNPLLDAGILQNVLSYVGPGQCLFIAAVSKWWKDIYALVEEQVVVEYDEDSCACAIITCVPKMTLYSTVFASPSRVMLAHNNGLDCTSAACQRAAGKHANNATLERAHELGMQITVIPMANAMRCYN
jgi:hypothetical protein